MTKCHIFIDKMSYSYFYSPPPSLSSFPFSSEYFLSPSIAKIIWILNELKASGFDSIYFLTAYFFSVFFIY